jgi:hypothetical protein
MVLKKIFYFLFMIFSIATMQCSNPAKDEPQKERVRLLVDDTFEDTGRYVFYWDGKDDNQKYVAPGKYIYAMQTKDYDSWDYITVNAGGKQGKNNEEHFEAGFWNNFELEDAYPNPFELQAGANIPFLVSEPARIKIIIYKD